MASSAIKELISEVKAANISAGVARGVQVANYYRGDVAWDPIVPPGHTQYTWTGVPAAPSASSLLLCSAQSFAAPAPAPAEEVKVEEKKVEEKVEEKAPAAEKPKKVKEQKPKAPAAAAPAATPASNQCELSRLDIRVGHVVSVRRHPEAEKLYIEQIDVGEPQPRQVLSGLVEFVPESVLNGADVLVICNFKPAALRGVESQGMVLAASNGDKTKVELVMAPAGSRPGERVVLENDNFQNSPADAEVNIKKKNNPWDTVRTDLKTNAELVATWKGQALVTSAGPCRVNSLADALIA
eukprot:TRINITY_DN560_c0_g2_i1.p2 TRINITY_DN560_c0_g2~~TRINITY_DN560_c0_g2_i1.p2  ORF type:complete len:319 (+),score=163.48 TRINITY_DN560_c0_g2_i1:68-958(+)